MATCVMGIDPGVHGAIAVVSVGRFCCVSDMPVTERTTSKGGKRHDISPPLLLRLLKTLKQDHHIALVMLEQAGPRPTDSGVVAFGFGRGFGVVECAVAALDLPVVMVAPSAWKKPFGLYGKDKSESRRRALELMPEAAEFLKRVKDDGRAEAALLAWSGVGRLRLPEVGETPGRPGEAA